MVSSPKSQVRVRHHVERDGGLQDGCADVPFPNLSFVDVSGESHASTHSGSALRTPQPPHTTRGHTYTRTEAPYTRSYLRAGESTRATTQGYMGVTTRPLTFRSGYGYTDRLNMGHARLRQAPVSTTKTPVHTSALVERAYNSEYDTKVIESDEYMPDANTQAGKRGIGIGSEDRSGGGANAFYGDAILAYRNHTFAGRNEFPESDGRTDTTGNNAGVGDPEDPITPLYMLHDFSRVYELIDRQRALSTGQLRQSRESAEEAAHLPSRLLPPAEMVESSVVSPQHSDHETTNEDTGPAPEEPTNGTTSEEAASTNHREPSGECNDECSVLSTDISDDGMRVRIAEKTHKGRRMRPKAAQASAAEVPHQVLDVKLIPERLPFENSTVVTERQKNTCSTKDAAATSPASSKAAQPLGVDELSVTRADSDRPVVATENRLKAEKSQEGLDITNTRRLSTQSWVGAQNTGRPSPHPVTEARASNMDEASRDACGAPAEAKTPLGGHEQGYNPGRESARVQEAGVKIVHNWNLGGGALKSDVSGLSDSFAFSDSETSVTIATSVSGFSDGSLRHYPPLKLSMPLSVKTDIALERSQYVSDVALDAVVDPDTSDRDLPQHMAVSTNTIQRVSRDGQPYLSVVTSSDSEAHSRVSVGSDEQSAIRVLQECLPITGNLRMISTEQTPTDTVRAVDQAGLVRRGIGPQSSDRNMRTTHAMARTPSSELSEVDSEITLKGIDAEERGASSSDASHDSYARLGQSAFGTLGTDYSTTTTEAFSDSSSYDGDVSSAMSHLSVVAESHKEVPRVQSPADRSHAEPGTAEVHPVPYSDVMRSLSRNNTHHLSVVAESSILGVTHLPGDDIPEQIHVRMSALGRAYSQPPESESVPVRSHSQATSNSVRVDTQTPVPAVADATPQNIDSTRREEVQSSFAVTRRSATGYHDGASKRSGLSHSPQSTRSSDTSLFSGSADVSDASGDAEGTQDELSIVYESPNSVAHTTGRGSPRAARSLTYETTAQPSTATRRDCGAPERVAKRSYGEASNGLRMNGDDLDIERDWTGVEHGKSMRDGADAESSCAQLGGVVNQTDSRNASSDSKSDSRASSGQRKTTVQSPVAPLVVEVYTYHDALATGSLSNRTRQVVSGQEPFSGHTLDQSDIETHNREAIPARAHPGRTHGPQDSSIKVIEVNDATPRVHVDAESNEGETNIAGQTLGAATLTPTPQAPGLLATGEGKVCTGVDEGSASKNTLDMTAGPSVVAVERQQGSFSLKDVQNRIDQARKQLSNIAANLGARSS